MDGHPYDLIKLEAHLREQIAMARGKRTRQIFDDVVRLLIAAEHRGAPRVNGHQIHEAATWLQRRPVFAGVDVDDCVRRLEDHYASRRAIGEASRG